MKKIQIDIVSTQTVEVELKPCPFCGGEKIDLECEEPPWVFIRCPCGATGPNSAEETKAVGHWNKRFNPDNPPQGEKETK